MNITEDRLAAYVDGELDAAGREAVEAAASADPSLAARLAAHQSLRDKLSRAYDPVLEEPIPAALLAAAQRRAEPPRHFGRMSAFAAMAACLAVGVLAGRATLPPPLTTPEMMAQGRLAAALDEGLASAPDGPVRLGVTFREHDGGFCRSFQTRGAQGLACRDGQAWRVQALAPSERQDGPFRTASSLPPALAAAIEARMAGEPLDAAAERAARDAHWAP